MRLIDADELLKGKTDHEMISTHLIFNAPTVDMFEKIKNEIEDYVCNHETNTDKAQGMLNVLQILDKYR